MQLEDFNYHLPRELIAQLPCEKRDESRLMILHRKDGTIKHRKFFELTDYLKHGDVVALNNTKVIPARLYGKKTTGGTVEILLIQRLQTADQNSLWRCLINPSKGLKKGSEILFDHGMYAMVIEKESGAWLINLHADTDIDKAIENIGTMPLPPYIKRASGENRISELDRERYQTIFAKEKGAIAAPTAGLHFTPELLKMIQNLGVEILYITLHTGIGTFKPVKEADITRHRMTPEYYDIHPSAFEAVRKAKQERRRIIAVGSTVTRTLETMVKQSWENPQLTGSTDLFIYPGYKFHVVDALITNFHLPKTTLLMLVAAFAGMDFIKMAYAEAVQLRYRFFSYGDAMMIM